MTYQTGRGFYDTVLGKPSQKPGGPEASEILLDRRIRPKGYDIAEYSFVIPEDAAGPLSYQVEVRYRSAPQSVVNELLGKDAPKLPVFDMGKVEEEEGLKLHGIERQTNDGV